MKHYILALVLAMASINAAIAANPIREGNMISGHVLVKGSEENIPYATVLIVGSGQGTVSNEEGQFELKNLPAGKYTLRVSAVGYKTQEKGDRGEQRLHRRCTFPDAGGELHDR